MLAVANPGASFCVELTVVDIDWEMPCMRHAGAPLMSVNKEQSEEVSEGAKKGSSRLLRAVVPLVCIVLKEVDDWGADCFSRLSPRLLSRRDVRAFFWGVSPVAFSKMSPPLGRVSTAPCQKCATP